MASTSPDSSQVNRVLAASSSKSAKIRALAGLGLDTSSIARLLGIRYQFAYNVLNRGGATSTPPESESTHAATIVPQQARVQIGEGGRLVIPSAFRTALDLQVGDDVLLRLEDGELAIFSPRQAIARAQAIIREFLPEGRSLSRELIEDRQEEDANE